MKTRLLMLATFVLFSSLFAINADGLIEELSLEDLAEQAEFVVIGKIIEISPLVPGPLLSFSDGYDRFQFDVTLSVDEDLDGTYGKDLILFRIHDSREEFGMTIEDEQNFEVGERVLVFIGKKEPDSVMGDAYIVHGVTQGKYLLKDGIAYGTDFPEGISEEELILKIKNTRPNKPIPEPEQDISIYENCGPGTELQDGICVVISENESVDTDVKWGDPFYEKLPSPDLEPIRDYDYEFIYMIILLTVVIIGSVVGGVIFVIRKKENEN